MKKGTVINREANTFDNLTERIEAIGRYIVDTGCTVRKAAPVFGVSKSTIYDYTSKSLKKINLNLKKKLLVFI